MINHCYNFRSTALTLLAIAAIASLCSFGKADTYQWQQVTNHAAWAGRDGAGALVYDNKMWLLGGWNNADSTHFPNSTVNDVWSSTNGANWTQVKANTFVKIGGVPFVPANDWEGRHTAGYAVFDDKMWIIGGDANQGHYQNDVWNSTDGNQWTKVASTVPWGPRVLHYTLSFQDKLWVMGGQTLPQLAPAAETFYRDIWNSSDGVNWQQVQPQGSYWPQRGMIGGSVVFNDRMWVIGGGTYDTPDVPERQVYNDVWSSADGVNWTQATANAPWAARQYHDVAVFDGKMWVVAGSGSDLKNRNDVWYSSDGANWNQLPSTPWGTRHASSLFVYDDALWVAAGNLSSANNSGTSAGRNDVWKLIRTTAIPDPGCAASTDCITFEPPNYSTTFTHSGLPAGTVNSQDGWNSVSNLGVGNMNVTAINPIAGQQSLLVNNDATATRAQASNLLDIGTPIRMSWLVRVDALGGGSGGAATRGVEFGVTTDPATGATPFTIIFNDAGRLQYYNSSNTNFSSNPTYTLGTVYRVDITDINGTDGTYDAAIFNNVTNALVASVTDAPLQAPLGSQGLHFYALRRGNPTGNAMVDDITALAAVPGDYNTDGVVNAADYVAWRDRLGSTSLPNEGSGVSPNVVNSHDYDFWRSQFGKVFGDSGSASSTSVPELSSFELIVASITIAAIGWRAFWM